MNEAPAHSRASQSATARRLPAWIRARLVSPAFWLLLVAALVGTLVLYKTARIGYAAWRTYQSAAALRDWAGELRADEDPLAALASNQAAIQDAAQSLALLERELRPLAPVLDRMGRFGPRGALVAAAPELLTVAAELSQAGSQGLALVGPAIQNTPPEERLPALLAALEGQEAVFQEMAARVERATRALNAVDPETLPPFLRQPVAQAQEILPLAAQALPLGPTLPYLLGMERPTTYLLLLQNNHELRATGGFISGVGRITFTRGRPDEPTITDSYAVDNLDVPHPPAPPPLQRYMQATILTVRDANWSPDLPTSARTVKTLYRLDQGLDVDGVVTLDLRAVELILDGLGGIRMPGVEEPITGANAVEILMQMWGNPLEAREEGQEFVEWWQQRKDFMPQLAQAALAKLRSGRINYWQLYRAARQALDERAIQIWVADPQVEAALVDWGWDGGLQPQEGADYLALVDSNVGFNKVDAVIRRSLSYQIAWPDGPEQGALATATVTYEHTLPVPGHECRHAARYGGDYQEMMRRCYFDYVRLYVPRGSRLIAIQGVEADSVESYPGEKRTQVFAGFFTMKPGETHTVTFTYRLPATIRPQDYRLVIQRQAGVGPLPVDWTLGATRYRTTLNGNVLTWTPTD